MPLNLASDRSLNFHTEPLARCSTTCLGWRGGLRCRRGDWRTRSQGAVLVQDRVSRSSHFIALLEPLRFEGDAVAHATEKQRRLERAEGDLAHGGSLATKLDVLGYLRLSGAGAKLLFEVISRRDGRGSTLVTCNLPFDGWTFVFGSEHLTGALLDRLTHHVHILEMNGEDA